MNKKKFNKLLPLEKKKIRKEFFKSKIWKSTLSLRILFFILIALFGIMSITTHEIEGLYFIDIIFVGLCLIYVVILFQLISKWYERPKAIEQGLKLYKKIIIFGLIFACIVSFVILIYTINRKNEIKDENTEKNKQVLEEFQCELKGGTYILGTCYTERK